MPRRYIGEVCWSVLEGTSKEIVATSADDALRKLLCSADADAGFYRCTRTFSDSAGPVSLEIWTADRKRLLRTSPGRDAKREQLFSEITAALQTALPLLPANLRRKYGRLLRDAEAARQ
jgi:hypothetical protein